mmetsp:Transcript_41682/g.110664  ORF Transcript_41682/g.110664 Transcript_41682/m.110664 type:complete len:301 (-) Transcript_41682:829-1731(-)
MQPSCSFMPQCPTSRAPATTSLLFVTVVVTKSLRETSPLGEPSVELVVAGAGWRPRSVSSSHVHGSPSWPPLASWEAHSGSQSVCPERLSHRRARTPRSSPSGATASPLASTTRAASVWWAACPCQDKHTRARAMLTLSGKECLPALSRRLRLLRGSERLGRLMSRPAADSSGRVCCWAGSPGGWWGSRASPRKTPPRQTSSSTQQSSLMKFSPAAVCQGFAGSIGPAVGSEARFLGCCLGDSISGALGSVRSKSMISSVVSRITGTGKTRCGAGFATGLFGSKATGWGRLTGRTRLASS